MNKTLLTGAIAALLAGPAMAQTASLDTIQKDIAEMKAKNERLEAEVDYLKENAKGERKDAAQKAVVLENLGTTVSKFAWSGDFRYRSEHITTAPNNTLPEHTRNRDRIRARLGVSVKVNDTITGKVQLATSGGATNDPRSTNQTLGEGNWTRKGVAIDQAYVDWRALSFLNVQLGKIPQPWIKTASYFWDGDITPEGAAVKFTKGMFFGSVSYDWLNERHIGNADTDARSDSKLAAVQAGIKLPMGTSALTFAAGYFNVSKVRDEVTSATAITPASTPATTCVANGTFFNNSTNGNSTYDNNGAVTASGCNALLSDFDVVNALVQFDFMIGKFPMSVFADYMQNLEAEVNTVAGKKLDTAYAAGVTFNKASAPKTWEVGVIYQVGEKDAVFGQFHDSDFGNGNTDTDGLVVKAGYAPYANTTVNATYFINKLNNDGVVSTNNTHDLDYKRLQLDLNFKF